MAQDDEFDRKDVIVSDLWRFTGAPTTVAGLHPSVLIGLPAMLLSLTVGLFRAVFFLWLLYIGFVYYLHSKHKISPIDWVKMKKTRFLKGNKWQVR
jgi:uncharacterized membrane protein